MLQWSPTQSLTGGGTPSIAPSMHPQPSQPPQPSLQPLFIPPPPLHHGPH